jgi:hypothetical protein
MTKPWAVFTVYLYHSAYCHILPRGHKYIQCCARNVLNLFQDALYQHFTQWAIKIEAKVCRTLAQPGPV